MDTVGPGEGIRPIVEKDRIVTDGKTILGGDCKSGIAVIIELIHQLQEQNLPHGDIEIALTICEEVGLLGAKHLDYSLIRAKTGLVLDSPHPLELTVRAPTADHLRFTVEGLEAHSGVEPEKGVSAIQIAAKAIAGMKLGRIDKETTANIGKIQGGLADNIIPPRVVAEGEARSLKESKLEAQTKHMCDCFERAAAELKGSVEAQVERAYPAVDMREDSKLAKLCAKAAKNLGKELKFRSAGGASDANIFFNRALEVADLGTGMRSIHTVRESLDLRDFYLCAELTLEVLKLHASKPAKPDRSKRIAA
jgi:tripeptide aminopeptidase